MARASPSQVVTAVLSTAAKAKRASKDKKAKGKDTSAPSAMDVDAGQGGDKEDDEDEDREGSKEKALVHGKEPKRKEPKEKEPASLTLHNPARVLPQQEALLTLLPNSRYVPIIKPRPAPASGQSAKLQRLSGFVMVQDTKPSEAEELLEPAQMGGSNVPADMEEPAPPAPFDFGGNP